jgi:hypothetical protein
MLSSNNLNTNNSAIKGVIDLWYEKKLLNTVYENLIDDNAIYCNDRRIASYGGWNPNGGKTDTSYEIRFAQYNGTNDLYCVRSQDAFATTNSIAHLNYPIGLISYPEMSNLGNNAVRGGAVAYWLGSPVYFSNYYAGERVTIIAGSFYNTTVNENSGIRPAIVLNSNAEFSSGTGSTTDPWIVKGSEMTP